MNDWLKEIEKDIVHQSYNSPEWIRVRRMARVLRELAGKLLELKKAHKHSPHVFYDLSPVAKELVDEHPPKR